MLPQKAHLGEVGVTIVEKRSKNNYKWLIELETQRQFGDEEIAQEISQRRAILYKEFYESFWRNKCELGCRAKIYDEGAFVSHVIEKFPEHFDKDIAEFDLGFLDVFNYLEQNYTKDDKKCLIPTLKGLNLYYSFSGRPIKKSECLKHNKFISDAIKKAKETLGVQY